MSHRMDTFQLAKHDHGKRGISSTCIASEAGGKSIHRSLIVDAVWILPVEGHLGRAQARKTFQGHRGRTIMEQSQTAWICISDALPRMQINQVIKLLAFSEVLSRNRAIFARAFPTLPQKSTLM